MDTDTQPTEKKGDEGVAVREERQVLNCTNCGRVVRFTMNFALDGNHEIRCPECGHIHYRVVQGGKITEERWNSSMNTYYAYNVTLSASSTSTGYIRVTTDTTGSSTAFLWDAWNQLA